MFSIGDSVATERRAQDVGDRPMVCAARNDLARSMLEAGDRAGATAEYRSVLVDATRMALKYEQARALDGIAACLRDSDPVEARRHWQRALALYRDMGVPEQAEVEQHLANLVG